MKKRFFTIFLLSSIIFCTNSTQNHDEIQNVFMYSGKLSNCPFSILYIDSSLICIVHMRTCSGSAGFYTCDTFIDTLSPITCNWIRFNKKSTSWENVVDTIKILGMVYDAKGYFHISWDKPFTDSLWIRDINFYSPIWSSNNVDIPFTISYGYCGSLESIISTIDTIYKVNLIRPSLN